MDKVGRGGKAGSASKTNERLANFGRKRQGVDFDWRCFSSPIFGAALGALASSGAAVMVGGAAGGRGAVISIYLDSDKNRTYINDGEAFLDWCHDVLETFSEPSEDIYAAYNLQRREE
jgi:hypothetical protein